MLLRLSLDMDIGATPDAPGLVDAPAQVDCEPADAVERMVLMRRMKYLYCRSVEICAAMGRGVVR